MDQNIQPVSAEDIFLWPDGTQCYREDWGLLSGWMSDDYEVIPYGTPRWKQVEEES